MGSVFSQVSMRALISVVPFLVLSLSSLTWAECTGTYPYPINECSNVSSTVHIPGGSYSSPYVINNPNTEYILDGDMTAAGKAISIQTSNVVVNLNGHTITYNQTSPGEGVATDNWNLHDIAVTNGSIVQDPSYDTNMPHTTLSAAITSSQTSFTVASSTGMTVGGTIIVAGDAIGQDEAMTITAILGNTLTVTRPIWNTSSNAHNSGDTVYQTKSEGDVYGVGNNPIRMYYFNVNTVQITDVNVTYGGRDVGGIVVAATNGIYEHNTINDLWGVGSVSNPHTLKSRQAGIDALIGNEQSQNNTTNSVFQYNTLNNIRHRCLSLGIGDVAHDNVITTNSMATNANAISVGPNCTVYNNTITARGEHPIGIAASSMGTANSLGTVNIYNNTVDVQTTRLGQEYGTSYSTTTATTGNAATGFVSKWGGGGVSFHNNTITGHSNASYMGQYSPTGAAALINAPTRGIQTGLITGETAQYQSNTVTVTDNDGTGTAYGLVVDGDPDTGTSQNSYGATFSNNTVTSNIMNVALGDLYGASPGWPLFIQNTFIKSGSFSSYATIGAGEGGYFKGTGRFVSNTYQNGASQGSLNMYFGSHAVDQGDGTAWHSLIFGRLMDATVQNSAGAALSSIQITTHNQPSVGDTESVTTNFGSGGSGGSGFGTQTITSPINYQTTTDANGNAQVIVYDYELTDISGSTLLSSVQQNNYNPHTIALYNLTTSQTLFTTLQDTSSFAWDALTSSGAHTLNSTNGSIIVNATPASPATAPTVTLASPTNAATVSGTVPVTASVSDK